MSDANVSVCVFWSKEYICTFNLTYEHTHAHVGFPGESGLVRCPLILFLRFCCVMLCKRGLSRDAMSVCLYIRYVGGFCQNQ